MFMISSTVIPTVSKNDVIANRMECARLTPAIVFAMAWAMHGGNSSLSTASKSPAPNSVLRSSRMVFISSIYGAQSSHILSGTSIGSEFCIRTRTASCKSRANSSFTMRTFPWSSLRFTNFHLRSFIELASLM